MRPAEFTGDDCYSVGFVKLGAGIIIYTGAGTDIDIVTSYFGDIRKGRDISSGRGLLGKGNGWQSNDTNKDKVIQVRAHFHISQKGSIQT